MAEQLTHGGEAAVSVTTEPRPSLTMDLTPEEARRIAAAQDQGVNLAVLLRGVIARLPHGGAGERAGAAAENSPHPGMTFAEILAPMREDFVATGMTDEELGELVDETVARVRARRRGRGLAEESLGNRQGPAPVRLTDENGRS